MKHLLHSGGIASLLLCLAYRTTDSSSASGQDSEVKFSKAVITSGTIGTCQLFGYRTEDKVSELKTMKTIIRNNLHHLSIRLIQAAF